MDWPLNIDDGEAIVRGICSPWHVSSKGKLKPGAFDPTPDTDEVSVFRLVMIGADDCKDRSFSLQDTSNPDPQKHKIYKGLGAISAGSIRGSGADAIDSRVHFLGHADVKLGIVKPRRDPLPADELFKLQALTKALAQATNYHVDPAPLEAGWSGDTLSP